MKFFLILALLSSSLSISAQMFIENTASRNAYEIHIYKNGKCIHWHTMKPNDKLKLDVSFGDEVYWEYICLTDICDGIEEIRINSLKAVGAVELSKQLKSVTPGKLNISMIHPLDIPIYRGWFNGYSGKIFIILPKLICKVEKKV